MSQQDPFQTWQHGEHFASLEIATPNATRATPPEPIAVVGVSARYPGAETLREFWENILAGRQAFRRFPACRMPVERYCGTDGDADRATLSRAAFIDGWTFDPLKWRVPQRTFESTDPVHWLALELATQAVEDAGGVDRLPRTRTAAYVGNTLTGEFTRANTLRLRWPFVEKVLRHSLEAHGVTDAARDSVSEHMARVFKGVFAPTNEDTLAGSLSNTIAGRICNHLDLGGGGYTVDGACASSLLAVVTAVERLAAGEIDAALAGGVDISLDPFELVGFSKAGALARGPLTIYDERASGMIPGEGAGFVVLRRLSDARRAGLPVYAVIRGWAISSDGSGAITAPQVGGQRRALEGAWRRAGYGPRDVDFIEGHGTGTAVGDRVELEAIAAALESLGGAADRAIGVGSLKSVIGHTKAAAGIGAFIKAVVAVNQRVLPPTTGCERPHAIFEARGRALYPLLEGAVREASDTLRAGVSSMGFGGINAHVTVESADPARLEWRPTRPLEQVLHDRRTSEVLLLAGHSQAALLETARRLAEEAAALSQGELADLAAHCARQLAGTGAPDAPAHRLAVVGKDPETLSLRLMAAAEDIEKGQPVPDGAFYGTGVAVPRIGVLFPGQGAQYVGMTRTIDRWTASQDEVFPRLAQRLEPHLAEALRDALLPTERARFDRLEPLSRLLARTESAQPALVYTSIRWWELFRELGMRPACVAGHSLGDLVALHVAGAFGTSTLLELARLRGLAMAGATDVEGMLSLTTDADGAAGLLRRAGTQALEPGRADFASIANLNGPRQTVVAGRIGALERLELEARRAQVSSRRLAVSRGFHSALMADAAACLAEHREIPEWTAPLEVPFISSMDGRLREGPVALRRYLAEQATARVDFLGVMKTLAERTDVVLELGPSGQLSALFDAQREIGGPRCLPVDRPGQGDDCAMTAVGALFALGAGLHWDRLFARRLVRPYIPAHQRVFLVNPCERPLPDLEQGPLRGREGPLAIERALEQRPRGASSLPSAHTSPMEGLKELITALTGFPASSLSEDHRLLDDLNLDSIKAGELVGTFARRYAPGKGMDPLSLANASLREIVARASAETESAVPVHSDWVHAFVAEARGLPPLEDVDGDVLEGQAFHLYALDARASAQLGAAVLESGGQISARSPHRIVLLPATNEGPGALLPLLLTAVEGLEEGGSLTVLDPEDGPPGAPRGRVDGVVSFFASVHLERPDLKVRVVGLGGHTLSTSSLKGALAEWPGPDPFRLVWRDADGGRWGRIMAYLPSGTAGSEGHGDGKQRLESHDGGERAPARAAWQERARCVPASSGVVLVTGGARGITAQCVLEVGWADHACMVLVGSSAPDGEVDAVLEAFYARGIAAHYLRCDLRRADAVRSLVSQVQVTFGPIRWLVHGAGVNRPRKVQGISLEEARAEVAPKLMGMAWLLEAIDPDGLERIVVLTSIIGVTGMPGNALYAYANESLERLVAGYCVRHPSVEYQCLAYSVWAGAGMGERLGSVANLARDGVRAIPRDVGVEHFRRACYASRTAGQYVVTGALGDRLLDTWTRLPARFEGRFLEQIRVEEPDVEIVADAQLSLERDRYLEDHRHRGRLLFPTVFGLEAMAQGVRRLCRPAWDGYRFEELRLTHPIVVDEAKGTTLRLRVYRRDGDRFHCSLLSSETGFALVHFEAEVVPSGSAETVQQPGPETALPLQPEDLYGDLLFQGQRFQCLEAVHAVSPRQCVVTVRAGLGNELEWYADPAQIVLGDPFRRDALLQAGQLMITPRVGLPVGIDALDIRPGAPGMSVRAVAHLEGERDGVVYGHVQAIDATGQVLERLEGYRIRILSDAPADLPSPEELVDPSARDQRRLEAVLKALASSQGVVIPRLRLCHHPELMSMARDARTALESQLLEMPLRRDPEGRPHADIAPDGTSPHVSISHDGTLLMVATDDHRVGIDVVKLGERPWQALVGDGQQALVGDGQQALLEALNARGVAEAGPRIWAAREALFKATGRHLYLDQVGASSGAALMLKAGQHQVLTVPIPMTWGRYMLAVTVRPQTAAVTATAGAGSSHDVSTAVGARLSPEDAATAGLYALEDHARGARGERRFLYRFPLSFTDLGNPSGTPYFSTYMHWVGKTREVGIRKDGIFQAAARHVRSGEYAWVTRETQLHVTGAPRSTDLIEVECWNERLYGPEDASLEMLYHFFARGPEGDRRMVAACAQTTTWAQVIEHGQVRPARYPDDMEPWIRETLPHHSAGSERLEPAQLEPFGDLVWAAPAGPDGGVLLAEHIVGTTPRHANLVGNVYWANYPDWMGEVRDLWSQSRHPYGSGELRCVFTHVRHLREAMPGDEVRTAMHLVARYERGLHLEFRFFRRMEDQWLKLATASHYALWHVPSASGEWRPAPFDGGGLP